MIQTDNVSSPQTQKSRAGADDVLSGLLYSQRSVEQLCAARALDWDEYAHMNEFHGNASVLKRYAGLPLAEPLPFAVEHAIPYDLDTAYEYDLNCGLPLFLAVHERSAALYRGGPIAEVLPIGATHLYAIDLFARLHPHAPEAQRRGTLVFPDKSTLLMETDFDRDAFAARLASLPEEFQPVVVCIYWRDVLRGNHEAYSKAGLPLVTCGHLRDGDFLLRLHDLCRRFKYACANDIAGSFVLSILSGCHFFHLPTGPVTQRKHGRTGTYERDPTLDKPQKSACLDAAPFPPASPEAQRALAHQLAGVEFKKSPAEIAALHAQAQALLRRGTSPVSLELSTQTALEPWHRLLPAGIDRDGWMRRDARLRVAHSPQVAAIRLTLDFRKPASDDETPVELNVNVQGKAFATLKPPRFHQEVLIPCDVGAEETKVEFHSSHASPLPGEQRERSLRLSKVELLDDAAAEDAFAAVAAKSKKRSGGKKAKPLEERASIPSLLRRLATKFLRRTPVSPAAPCNTAGRSYKNPKEPVAPAPPVSQPPMSSTIAPGSPRRDCNGLCAKMPDRPAIYFIDGGFKRLVPGPETFNNLFRDWKNIVTHLSLDDIPDGPELSSGAALVRASHGDTIYLIDRGMKRAVAGADVMERYHFNEKKIAAVPPILLELIPTGRPLALPVTGT